MSVPAAALVPRLVRVIEEVTGIAIPSQRFVDVEREAIRRAQVRCRGQIADYAILVEGSRAEAEVLAELLTIGETYFFRHWADFLVLRDVLLPPLFERESAGGPPPRLWSAACSTGEEPYSLAMLVESSSPQSRAEVLATDLSDARLVLARDAVYGERSMRSVGGMLLDRFLEPAGPKLHRVTKAARARVRFQRHNLGAATLPMSVLAGHVDVILCRNALIYFGRDAIDEVLTRFNLALAEGGCLIVSSAEAALRTIGALRWESFESSAVYRKASLSGAAASNGLTPDSDEPTAKAPTVPYEGWKPCVVRSSPQRPAVPPEPRALVVGRLLLARARRDRARGGEDALRRASRLAAAAVARLPLEPAAARLAALLLLDLNEPAVALPFARRAASLGPGDPMAQLALARALEGAGHSDAAAVALRNVEYAAGSIPGAQRLEDADGMTASVLLASIRAEREARIVM